MKNMSEIITLESSSPRRSKSVSANTDFYAPRITSRRNLLERREQDMGYDDEGRVEEREEAAIGSSMNFSNMKISDHNKKVSANINKYSNFEESPYQYLEHKYTKLREKYSIMKKDCIHWRSSYFNLLKDSLVFDETIKTLYEENRIHLEYIISLENKINKLLVSCNNITNNFHQNLCKSLNMGEVNLPTSSSQNSNQSNMNNLYIRNFNEVLNDYKKQLEILVDEKDNLNTNLSISRHQQLQYSMRLEELQDRVYRVEQSRYDDIRALQMSQS
jgi:hypothetical protein